VRIGQLQHFAHQIDAISEARLADLRAVRAAQRFGSEFFGGFQPGGLAQGPEEKKGARRLAPGLVTSVM
jgi:hypothetical protein